MRKFKLTAEQLVVRPIGPEDKENVKSYGQDSDITMMMYYPMSDEDIDQYLQYCEINWQKEPFKDLQFIIEMNGKVVGMMSFEVFCELENAYEIGWLVNRQYRNHNIATTAAKLLMKYAFEELNADYVVADCDKNNLASQRVMEKIGLKLYQNNRIRIYSKTNLQATEYLFICNKKQCPDSVKNIKMNIIEQ